MSQEVLYSLLSETDCLFRHLFWFKQAFDILPSKEHVGTSIAYTDVLSRIDDFLKELRKTIIGWVYSQEKAKAIFDSRLQQTHDFANAMAHVDVLAKSKFRPGLPKGQFGELLLFNFIQFFFKAPPLLRKMPLTTTSSMERFGVDAIHYGTDGVNNILYLGEAKCYTSSFKAALSKALDSITTTFNSLNSELDLYVYDDFITPSLQEIAEKYKSNSLENVKYELICMLVYEEDEFVGMNQQEKENAIRQSIDAKTKSFDKNKFNSIDPALLSKIHYIFFPIPNLEALLSKFESL